MMIGVGLDARLGLPFEQLRAVAREAERLGFESLWTPAGGVPDSFHVCSAWSQDTALRTGISVVPAARMWTPMGLAAQAATLAQLSDGRFVLGVGTGGYGPKFWASVGLPDRPIAIMRQYVGAIRGLLACEQVTAGPIIARAGMGSGAPGWPQSASLGIGALPAAPVALAALGPQMLRLAGEAADGACLNWASPDQIAWSRERLAEGATKAGRVSPSVTRTSIASPRCSATEGAWSKVNSTRNRPLVTWGRTRLTVRVSARPSSSAEAFWPGATRPR